MYIFQPDRYLLQKQVKKYAHYITGRVLDVGAGEFSRYQQFFKYSDYVKMDIKDGENIDIVGKAEEIPLPDESFNSIVCTQVLGDVAEPQKALKEFYRVLKPGGAVLLTESFINEMHDEPNDFWRFTNFAMKMLFEKAGFKIIEIDQRGGFFATMAQEHIRYLIDRFHLYNRRISILIRPLFSIYGRWMIFLDSLDSSRANKKHAIGWCVVAKKL